MDTVKVLVDLNKDLTALSIPKFLTSVSVVVIKFIRCSDEADDKRNLKQTIQKLQTFLENASESLSSHVTELHLIVEVPVAASEVSPPFASQTCLVDAHSFSLRAFKAR